MSPGFAGFFQLISYLQTNIDKDIFIDVFLLLLGKAGKRIVNDFAARGEFVEEGQFGITTGLNAFLRCFSDQSSVAVNSIAIGTVILVFVGQPLCTVYEDVLFEDIFRIERRFYDIVALSQ